MTEIFKSKYTGDEIDHLLGRAETALQPEDVEEKYSHSNLDILNNFTEVDGELYYKGRKVSLESLEE